MKKICTVIVVLLLAAALLVSASAVTDSATGLTYTDNGDGTATVTGTVKYSDVTLSIPETLGGLTVTKIGSGAFRSKNALQTVRIPSTVTEIESYAFYNCQHITTVVLGENVKTIGDYAFNTCVALTAINLKNVESVGAYSFYGCKRITTLNCGNKLKVIGARAFSKCNYLERITFSQTLEEIGDYAFSDCIALTAVSFPASLKKIGNSAFKGCNVLETVTFPASGDLVIGAYAFEECLALKTVTLTPAVSEIGRYAFALRESNSTEFSHDIEIISTGSPAAGIYGSLYGVKVKENGAVISGYGDADGNGKITTADARAVLRVVGKMSAGYSAAKTEKLDLNKNGMLDLEDVSIILKVATGII